MIKPSDNAAYRYPVSVKGVVCVDGKIPLLKNERDEFELPGGKLELDEQPNVCVGREIKEELNIDVEVIGIIDSWLYHIDGDTHVLIVTYACRTNNKTSDLKYSSEHKELGVFELDEIKDLVMPEGYKSSIEKYRASLC
ncbi:NUDIX hydrolase [Piscirickettsia litoralis]|uniref:Nudix hydrolase domain-containing protein n=1 Tax=Piscirickettsia litoralis TaxID=1891921 RepID=A0ABX2ZX52_9GAMM|nr:NUDIX domain-containing protein [Piscirickettsia litoralis]ODN41206.1 hypothetical protein BGC07_17485 [Piscirickettsia litoralis]